MRRLVVLLATAAVLVGPADAARAGSAEAGARKIETNGCVTCHGRDGIGTSPLFPSLAGQPAAYLEQQLLAFRSGARRSEVMNVVAQPLSDADIADLAAYYESRDPCGER